MKLERLDLLTGILVTIIWGCNFSVIELGLKSLDPFVLTLLRFTFCAIPLVFFMKKPDNVSYASLATYGVLFGVGLWWVVNFAMYSGLSAGMSSVFLQFSAFFTIIMSRIFLAEAINKVHGIGIFLSISGLLMILYYSEETSTISGILLVLLAAFSWSLCNLIVKMKKPADMVGIYCMVQPVFRAGDLRDDSAVRGRQTLSKPGIRLFLGGGIFYFLPVLYHHHLRLQDVE